MSIFKPSSHSPNLEEVDLNESNEFSCLVNTSGEPIKAYKMTVLSEDGTKTIADGYWKTIATEPGEVVPHYQDGATSLGISLANKKTLKIPGISSEFHKPDETFANGKNYQWGVRTYNAVVGSTAQPNTKVCEGYLVGSTKYVIWSNIPKSNTEVLDQLVYDRYIEFSAADGNELIIGAHEAKDKALPDTYPFVQRRKIDWVTKELGTENDYVKIEVAENFDYDYNDGKTYTIYKCASDHTVNSAFADPNSNINVSNFIILYESVSDAQKAFTGGDTPEETKSGVKPFGTSRKISGYSSDTGEIRVTDAWTAAPANGYAYRIFTYDTLTQTYQENFSSDITFKAKVGATYYILTAPVGATYYATTVPSGTKYYSLSGSTATEVGTLSNITSCRLKGQYTISGSSVMCSDITLTTYDVAVGTDLYDKTVGKVDYYSDPALQNKVGTLTAASTDCVYISDVVSSIYDSAHSKTYYVATTKSLGTILSTDTEISCTKVTDTYSNITFKRSGSTKNAYVKTSALVSHNHDYIVPSVVGGTLSEDTSYTFNNTTYSTIKVLTKTYQVFTVPGGVVGAADNFIANSVNSQGGTIVVNGASNQVAFNDLICTLKEEVLQNPFEAQVIGGRPIARELFKVVTNRWDNWDYCLAGTKYYSDTTLTTYVDTLKNGWIASYNDGDTYATIRILVPVEPGTSEWRTYYIAVSDYHKATHRLFIQPNINIKSDTSNPDELVFDNGVRIDIVEQYWTNDAVTPSQKVDITFNKLDNTQWLLEDSSRNESGKTITAILPEGAYVPTTPQTDYNVFTDFADSMPYNILYARTAPIVTLQFRNALKEMKLGYLSNGSFYDREDTLIPTSEFYLYYDEPNSLYYKWSVTNGVGSYVHVPSLLIEGKYDGTNFWDETQTTVYPRNTDWLYYDTISKRYFIYSSTLTSYQETDNVDVVWVNVDSLIPREYREVEFRTLWQDSQGNTVLNPQIKNYQYSLYAYPPNGTIAELIKESKTYYDIDPKWIFRGLDGTPSSDYSILNPHKYKVEALITDEYDKEYLISADFRIFYGTENAPVSIKVDLLCDEQANQVNVSPPTYAQTTSYGGRATVTNDNVDTENALVTIPNNYTLNYTQTTSGMPLTFPKNFSTLTKIRLTDDFIDKYSTTREEAELFTVSHSLETTKVIVASASEFYPTIAPIGMPYYLDATFEVLKGTLLERRPYTLYEDTSSEIARKYGTLTLSDYDLSVFYINVEDNRLGKKVSNAEITNEMTGVTISQTNTIYSTVTLTQATCGVSAGTYYVLNRCIRSEENNEEFKYTVNVYGSYYIDTTDNKVHKNTECYHMYMYRKGPGESTYSRLQGCFYVDGHWQDYINLMEADIPEGEETEVKTLYAIQSNLAKGYIIAEDGLPEAAAADPNKKYVLTQDSTQGTTIYTAGIYRVQVYSGGQRAWTPAIDEDYVYLENTSDMAPTAPATEVTYEDLGIAANDTQLIPQLKDGTKVDNTHWAITVEGETTTYDLSQPCVFESNVDNSYFVYRDIQNPSNYKYYAWNGTTLEEITNYTNTKGQINYSDDREELSTTNYIWLDTGVNQSAFKSFIRDKIINIFLAVKYDVGGNRTLKSQVLLVNKKQ